MVEDLEIKMRSTLETIYFGKTKDVANELRQSMSAQDLKKRKEVQSAISGAMNR